MILPPTSQAISSILNSLLATNQPYGMGNTGYTVRLGQNTVTPGSVAGWMNATFPGYVDITTGAGFTNGNDSIALQPTLTYGPPAGGFRWTANSGINTPQSINSVRIDFSNGTPIASGSVLPAQSVSNPGDQINLGPLQTIITVPAPVG